MSRLEDIIRDVRASLVRHDAERVRLEQVANRVLDSTSKWPRADRSAEDLSHEMKPEDTGRKPS